MRPLLKHERGNADPRGGVGKADAVEGAPAYNIDDEM